jgi:hypothetical protein
VPAQNPRGSLPLHRERCSAMESQLTYCSITAGTQYLSSRLHPVAPRGGVGAKPPPRRRTWLPCCFVGRGIVSGYIEHMQKLSSEAVQKLLVLFKERSLLHYRTTLTLPVLQSRSPNGLTSVMSSSCSYTAAVEASKPKQVGRSAD